MKFLGQKSPIIIQKVTYFKKKKGIILMLNQPTIREGYKMTVDDLIDYYQNEIHKMMQEKEKGYVDEFETEWTISLYQEFLEKLNQLTISKQNKKR